MAKVDLVFRHVSERTADVALDLAVRHIQPENVHVMDNVRPFTKCVVDMLKIEHECDYVVYMDADCLILEDIRPFIDQCEAPYFDAYVSDYFRGREHCGLHITRIDVVREMGRLDAPGPTDLRFVLRPESSMRNNALQRMRFDPLFHNFDILHDHFQHRRDIFHKYALRQLRSRTPLQRRRLDMCIAHWPRTTSHIDDFAIARRAIEYTVEQVPEGADPETIDEYIGSLFGRADRELERLGIGEKASFSHAELDDWLERNDARIKYTHRAGQTKVFGLGLSRTGTQSLTDALQVLGYNVVHYPQDEGTYEALAAGRYNLGILDTYDGVTDITAAPFFAQFDREYPGSKFILTVRDTENWLRSCETHWAKDPNLRRRADDEVRTRLRLLLRAAVYGSYDFSAERFRWVYQQHVSNVLDYFKDRPEDLLVLDVSGGEGYEKLAPFLGRPVPAEPFPQKNRGAGRQRGKSPGQTRAVVEAEVSLAGVERGSDMSGASPVRNRTGSGRLRNLPRRCVRFAAARIRRAARSGWMLRLREGRRY